MNALSDFLPGSSSHVTASADLPRFNDTQPKSNERLEKAGTDFEAVLLTQWLQSADKSFASVPTDDDDKDEASDQMKDVGLQAVAQQLSRSDMLGIAHMVTGALRHSAASSAGQNNASLSAPKP